MIAADLLLRDTPEAARVLRAISRYEQLIDAAKVHGIDLLAGLIEDADAELVDALACLEEFIA